MVAIPTVSDGLPLDATWYNLVKQAIEEHDAALVATRVGCRLRAEAQSIPTGAQTNINWSTEDEDTNGFHAGSSATVAVPTGLGGLYASTLNVRRNGSTNLLGSRMFAALTLSSSLTGMPVEFRMPSNATEDIVVVGFVLPLEAGDTVTASWYHEHGSNYTPLCWMSLYRIGA